MIKVEKTVPEPAVTFTTTLYGAELIQALISSYVYSARDDGMGTVLAANRRLIDAINCPGFKYDAVKVDKLFR